MTRYKKAVMVILATLILAPASWGWAQIYKVTDDKDGVVFTDSPQVMGSTSDKSIEQIELKELNTAAPVQVRPPSTTNSRNTGNNSAADEPAKPTVSIASPANESTVAMGPGNFTVSASATPPVSPSERLVLLIDGVARGQAQSTGTWFVEGALRGPHDLVVQRTNTRGTVIASSEPVRIYVLRPSIIGR